MPLLFLIKTIGFFLMRSPKWKGSRHVVPGARIELGETIKEALKRGIKKETNLEIPNIEFIGMKEFVFGKEFYKKRHFIFLDYFCRARSEKVILDGEEGTEYIWVSVKEALNLSIGKFTKVGILQCKDKI